MGKTRFVAEIAATAAELGMRVVSGGCANIGQGGLPYGALVEALRRVASELDPDELAAAVGPAAADLARLAPDIAPQFAAGPDTDPALEPWQQARLMESLLGFLGRLAAAAPVLLVDRGRPLGRSGDPRDPDVPGAQPADRAGAGAP